MAARANAVLTLNGRVSWPFWLILLILALALGLRLHGVDWDQGHGFHPDERDIYMRSGCMYDLLTEGSGYQDCGYVRDQPNAEPGLPGIGTALDSERSPLNPHWFPLGSILIYVMVFFRSVAELFTDLSALDMRFFGRPLSALADVGSVFLVFAVGRRLYGQKVGLLAAGLTAVSVVHIQNSHFYRPETFTVFFALASFWAMLRMMEHRRVRDSALLGLFLGLALAPKVAVLPFLAPLALAYLYRVWDEADGRFNGVTQGVACRVFGHAALAVVIAGALFFVTSPYALLDFGSFQHDLDLQTEMARNAGLWPFTVQYIDTPAFFYQIKQTAVWGLGFPLGIVAWLSIPFTAVLAIASKKARRADLLLLAWVVPAFIFLESFEVRFQRYVFPLVPVLVLLGSRMLVWKVESAAALGRSLVAAGKPAARLLPVAAVALVVFVAVATAFYALAFQRVYANEHPAVAASQWINETLPPGSAIVIDNHWDEFIPNLHRYNVWQYPVYELDAPNKMAELARRLADSELLVFYSSRPYTSAARDPARFPRSNAYYQRLFSGWLGYELDREFTSYPQLAGVAFRDDALARAGLHSPEPKSAGQSSKFNLDLGYADDNVVGYDHPRVLVFRNAAHLPEGDLRALLAGPLPQASSSRTTGLLLSDEGRVAQQNGDNFSGIVARDGWTNDLPILAWLLVVELIYLAALPLAIFIFRPLPDRGIILGRVLGLLGVSYVAWLVVSLGWVDYSRYVVYLGLGVLGSLSGLVLALRWEEIREFVRQHWRLLIMGEVLFLVTFLGFVALRYANPDLWHPFRGGEKPMELAYLNAVVRSTTLPPYDPWFAGGYLNYYYWGYFVISGVIRVTGILPTTAFNLAVPMFFALTVTGAYSLVYNLAEGVRRHRMADELGPPGGPAALRTLAAAEGTIPGTTGWRARVWSPVSGGLMAGLFTAVVGNLDGMVQIVQGTWHKLVDGAAFPAFDFWRSSRMVPPLDSFDPSPVAFWVPNAVPGASDVSFHITEFPFFTFLFADLHAHMMVIPFTLLVLGLGLNLVVGLRNGGWLWTLISAAALALALGSLWVVNSWDYPSYALLTAALLGLAVYFTDWRVAAKLALWACLAGGVLALSLVAFLPFHQAYESFNSGLDVSRWRTPVDRYWAVHGLFLFVALTFLWVQLRGSFLNLISGLINRRPTSQVPYLPWAKAFGLVCISAAVVLAAAEYWNAAMLVVFSMFAGLAGWRVLGSGGSGRAFAVVPVLLLITAFSLAIGVDFVTVEGDIGRMNTFFKYYLEIWVLMALAAAYMLWYLGAFGFLRHRWGLLPIAWVAVLGVLIGSSLVYTVLGSRDRLADRFTPLPATLDGAAYMADAVHSEGGQPIELKWDLDAINWLQDTVKGSPVILEAHLEQYRWGGRISVYTGLPTVIGWPWHQIQQRTAYNFGVHQRAAHVEEIYETVDLKRALELLRRYEVEYVIVGDLERSVYAAGGLAKFPDLEEAGLARKVFSNMGTSVYQGEW